MLEICIDSIESAIIASKCGADRLEVCSSLVTGGITPHIPFIKTLKKYTDIPLNILIRPRHGDFLYSKYEVEQMKLYIKTLANEKLAHGIIIGALTKDGDLDIDVMKQLIDSSGGMYVTCHRAFDMVRDQNKALIDLIDLKVNCVLTSGGLDSAIKGIENIKELTTLADGKIDIMPGAGINLDNFLEIKKNINPKYIHLSAKETLKSSMLYRNENLSMGQSTIDEFSIFRTSESTLKQIVKLNSK
jgi:copper homeostasis protein